MSPERPLMPPDDDAPTIADLTAALRDATREVGAMREQRDIAIDARRKAEKERDEYATTCQSQLRELAVLAGLYAVAVRDLARLVAGDDTEKEANR